MDLQIKGKVALVAGATGGLGLAVAQALSAEGARVAICGRRLDVAAERAAELTDALAVELDLTDPDSIAQAVAGVREQWGPVDILVVNGGGPAPSTAVGLDVAGNQSAATLLLDGPLRLIGECLPDMRKRSWGRVVAVGSSAVQQPIPGLTTSSMFRSALASYLKLLSREVAAEGITVNMVLPGRIDTDRVAFLDGARAKATDSTPEDVRLQSEAAIPTGRYGRPEEFASLVAYLCGTPAAYVTGEQLRVDGGLIHAL